MLRVLGPIAVGHIVELERGLGRRQLCDQRPRPLALGRFYFFGFTLLCAFRRAVKHGTKRLRRMFADADLDEFITNQTRKDVPCPSTRTETVARRISTTTSKCEVIGFTARRNARRAAKPKR